MYGLMCICACVCVCVCVCVYYIYIYDMHTCMDLGRVSLCRDLNGCMNTYFLSMYGGLHKIEKNVFSLLNLKKVQLK